MPEKRPDLETKHKMFIRAPREKVYDAFATAEGLDGWFTRGSRVDARPGGAMLFKWVDWGAEKDINVEAPGRVLEAKRPERFVFEWGGPGSESTVEIVLEERDDGTLVRLREYGFRKIENVIENAGGWGEALTLVKFWVEHRIAINR
ncbi:MAG TPA: SRPBCC domain-containing protein [Candidatus Limnocylindria bacterium]